MQHGLHFNRKGKEQAAKTVVSTTQEIFKLKKKEDPMIMN